jgi:hypothetical protein
MGQHHPLRHRRRPRREEQLPDVVAVDRRIGIVRRLAVDEGAQRLAPCDGLTPDLDRQSGPPPGVLDRGGVARPDLGVDHEQGRFDAGEDVDDDDRIERRVERGDDESGLGHTELDEEGLHRIFAEHGHDVALPQASGRQGMGDAVGGRVGLPVGQAGVGLVGPGAGGTDDGDAFGVAPRQPFDHVADGGPVPAVVGPAVVQAGHVDVGHGRSP